MNRYIIDTNTVYEMLAFNGTNLNGVKTLDRTDINYLKLKKFIFRNLKQKKLYISPVSIFEILNKLRHDENDTKKAFDELETIKKTYRYDLFCNDLGKNVFSLDDSVMNKIRNNYCEVLNYKDIILKTKIESESNLLYLFPFQIVIFYLLAVHYGNNEYEKTYEIYINSFVKKNCDYISKIMKKYILNNLQLNYDEKKEKKSFRKMFVDVITEYSMYTFYPFDYIHDCLSNNTSPTFDISSIINNASDDIIENYKNWYKTLEKKEHVFQDIFSIIEKDFKSKNYSKSQFEYLKSVIYDFFTNKTKMDTNDAIDFWLLGYIRNDFYIVTFDAQMIDVIQKSCKNNINLINCFLSKKTYEGA